MKAKLLKWMRAGRRILVEWLKSLELLLFRLTMWAIVACSIIGIVRRAGLTRPDWFPAGVFASLDSVPFHYLLISAAVAALLALVVPKVLSRITVLTFGGVTLVLATTEPALDDFKSAFDDLPRSGVAFEVNRLSGPQRYQYERLSYKLYRILDSLKDPLSLDYVSRESYRRLIDYVGRAACKQSHFTKYLEVVRSLEPFANIDPRWDELFLIGNAYLWAAEEEMDKSKQDSYLKRSVGFLEAAFKHNTNDVNIPFNLGLAQLKLGYNHKAINYMRLCVSMYPPIAANANYNWAEALKNLNRNDDALAKLNEIPPGPLWQDIANDEAFRDPNDPGFVSEFNALCASRIAQGSV